jgi:hypothetical protein
MPCATFCQRVRVSFAHFQERLIIRLDDVVTGFSADNPKKGRPYLITRVHGDPLDFVYVVPRSKTGWEGVETPANEPWGLNFPGKFLLDPIYLDAADVEGAEVVGPLPDVHWERIYPRLNTFLMDIE